MIGINSKCKVSILFLVVCAISCLGSAGTSDAQVAVTGAKTTVAASTATSESLNIPGGAAPTSPATGAVFFDGVELYFNDGVASQPHPRIARLAADSSASTSTTMAPLTGISFTLAKNTAYTVSCDVFYVVSATTGGLALTFTGPASPSNVIFGGYEGKGSNNSTYNSVATAFSGVIFNQLATTASPTILAVHISGTLEIAGSSGSLQLQYANAASGAGSVTIKRGSWCTVQ